MIVIHSQTYINLRHDFFRVCVFIAFNSFLKNFLPNSNIFKRFPVLHESYCWFVDFVAACSLSWRVNSPSLDQEFMGFRRRFRHARRNWYQDRIDRSTR